MQLGFVGLGKMGGFMVRRLVQAGRQVVAYDRNADAVKTAESHGARGAGSLEELMRALTPPRAAWVMVPSGAPTTETVRALAGLAQKGDVIVDGGNSRFHDTVALHAELKAKGVDFVDSGTSGGVWGLKNGYCLMIGGDQAPVARLKPIFDGLAPPEGWAHVGGPGAGHYVKMVHNGVEYGMMQAYAEGFDLLKNGRYKCDLHQVAKLWNRGSVVRSWLCELAEDLFKANPDLAGMKAWVPDSGEGRWTVQEAIDADVPAPVLTLSLLARLQSRQVDSFAMRTLAGLRNAFGGHAVKTD
ncbi:MAG TPA: decarboxylating 6-phosphogluconate dehydrogenase [Planctomycetota bacterium]|nr:decarboxylating 6-phosphogluconate dehydrogenase [Planctomycetota bacterium]